MSQKHVEAFLRGSEAANTRDIEALLAVLDPEVEWHPAMAALLGREATVYRGHEGVRAWLRDQEDSFVESRIDYSEVRALGERVVAIGRLHARGAESRAKIESPVGWVAELRNGKVIHAKACAAAAGPASVRERVEEFGRRRDVSPQAFGFCVEETPEGLRYRWAAPSA